MAGSGSINTAQIVTNLGGYAESHFKPLFQRSYYNPLVEGVTTAWNHIGRKVIIDGKVASGRMRLDLKTKRTSNTFTPQTDAILFGGDRTNVYEFEVDLTIPLDYMVRTWLAHVQEESIRLNKQVGVDDIPLGQVILDSLVKQFVERMFLEASFEGVYDANATYTQSWGGAFDGINKIIANARNAGLITSVVATGAISSTDAYADFELMGKSTPRHLYYQPQFLFAGLNACDDYNEDYASVFDSSNQLIYPEYNVQRLRNRQRIGILPCPENTTDAMFITTSENVSWVMDFNSPEFMPKIRISALDPKNIGINMKASAGIHIASYEDMTINDQFPA